MTDTFTWRAITDSSGSGEFRTKTTDFGDGYSQDVPDGLNTERQEWSVVLSGHSSFVGEALAFIREHKGMSFFWKAPLTTLPGYYKCKSYRVNDQGGDYWILSMTFEQAFAP